MAYAYPPAAVGSIFQATFMMTSVGQRLMNTYHWRLETNPTNETIEAVCNGLNTTLSAAGGLIPTHNALRDESVILDNVTIQQIATLRYAPKVYVKTVGGDITTAAAGLDTGNVCAVIERRGVNATRGDVGKVHIPIPLAAAVIQAGLIVGGYAALLTAHAGIIQADQNLASGSTLKPVVYHKGKTPNYSYIGAAFYQETVRVMRRRTVRVGI